MTTQDRLLSDEELLNEIAEHLKGDMAVTRVWEAWQVGTMTQDDFVPLEETERPQEILHLINTQKRLAIEQAVLEAIEKIKSNSSSEMRVIMGNTEFIDKVPLSAIEAIEKEYRNE